MSRFIVFANRKGGCGKTTTVVNVAQALAEKGKKVLVIDIDPQSHSGISLGYSPRKEGPGILSLLKKEARLSEVILETSIPGVFLVPSSPLLSAFEIEFSLQKGSETLLADQLMEKTADFDYLIIDPPPTAGLLMVSGLVAAREVYIPMQMHFLAMEGLAEMMRLIYTINATWNPGLRLMGVIPTFYNKTTRLARQITEEIRKNFGEEKLYPAIRMSVRLAEAPGHGKTALTYAPHSSGAIDYRVLAQKIDTSAFC